MGDQWGDFWGIGKKRKSQLHGKRSSRITSAKQSTSLCHSERSVESRPAFNSPKNHALTSAAKQSPAIHDVASLHICHREKRSDEAISHNS